MSETKSQEPNSAGPPAELENPSPHQSANKPARAARKKAGRAPPIYDTVESAAGKLSLDPTALRARLRRAQRAEGDSVVADLGGGIRAFKLGKSWRVRFPEP